MSSQLLTFFLIHLIMFCGLQAADSDYYSAGVVEFRPNLVGMSSADMLADHLNAYEEIIRSAAANETDIIVFPEGTLNNMFQMTYVPAAAEKVIPCLQNIDYADFLVQLSCTARDVKKYLVINLTEKENCSAVFNDPRPCATTGINVYNTNVVFDREGRVISRYRKVHIYVENKNTTLEPEYAIFDTDFGVRFGHFICFDILFYTPAQELVTKYNVKNIIFTSLFYSELPFLTATQLQQSWAWGNNVNLLASGASYPEAGITGSGVYAGSSGHLISVMICGTGERKLYVAKLHKKRIDEKKSLQSQPDSFQRRETGIKLMKDSQIAKYSSKLLDIQSNPTVDEDVCHNNLCCHFSINATFAIPVEESKVYRYRIGVFNGRRTYEKQEWSDLKVCGIYACTGEDPDSCGEIFDGNEKVENNVQFEFIEINGYFDQSGEPLIMPNTLTDKLNSLNPNSVKWQVTKVGHQFDVNFRLIEPNNRLLTFAIYSHYFKSSAQSIYSDLILIGLLIISILFSTTYN